LRVVATSDDSQVVITDGETLFRDLDIDGHSFGGLTPFPRECRQCAAMSQLRPIIPVSIQCTSSMTTTSCPAVVMARCTGGVEDPIVIAALTRPFLLWDTASGRLDSLPTRAGFRQRLARDPHSDRLAANSDSGVVVRRLNSPTQRLLLPTRGASVPCERCHLHTRRPVGSLRQLGRHRATLAYRHGDRCDRRGCGTGAIPSGTERSQSIQRHNTHPL
jgi:hypothetical protein